MLLSLLLLTAAAPAVQDSAHLVIVATTDVHGRATGWDYVNDRPWAGGLVRAARPIDSLRAAYPDQVVLVDAGDLLQGDPFAAYFAQVAPRDPNPIVDVMNQLGYDVATPGNHDFNFGVGPLREMLRRASFRVVSANIVTEPSGDPMFGRQTVLLRQGVRVGVTGFTTPGVMIWDRNNVRGQVLVERIGSTAPGELARLRQESDFVITLVHSGMDGASSYDSLGVGPENVAASLAAGAVRPDLVVVGHSHRQMRDSVLNGVHFIQPKPYAQTLAVAHVDLVREGGTWRVSRIRGEQIDLAGLEPPPGRFRRVAEAQDAVRIWASTPLAVGTAAMPGRDGRVEAVPLTTWINEVQRRQAGTDLASTAVFNPRAGLPAGEIRLADVAGVYPYENTLRGIRITGAQLAAYLEQSAQYYTVDSTGTVGTDSTIPGYNFDVVTGAEYELDLSQPVGSRVRGLRVNGRDVVPSATYTLALNSYRQEGGGGFEALRGAPLVYDQTESVRELLVADLRRRGQIDPMQFGAHNWRITPPAALASARLLTRPPARDTLQLRILTINDFHGALEPRVYNWSDGRLVGGAAAVDATMDSLAARCDCTTLRLDGGDEMQGTLPSNLTYGRTTIEAFDLMGIQAAAIGNHDFDWSADTLRARMREADYPWVAANIFDSLTGKRPDWITPWRMVRAGKYQVAVVGFITGETKAIVDPQNIAGLTFGSGYASIKDVVEEARSANPDFLVLLAHAGGRCDSLACAGEIFDMAQSLPPGTIDLIVSGHSHTRIDAERNGVPIVQARNNGTAVGVVDIIRTADGARKIDVDVQTVWVDQVTPDSAIAALVARSVRTTDSLAKRIITDIALPLPRTGGQYALGNLIADAFRNVLRADVALVNNGGIRADVAAGPLTFGQLFTLMPFQNEAVTVTVTGAQLRQAVEQGIHDSGPDAHVSGMRVTYDMGRPAGQRVREIRLADGKKLRDKQQYTLAVNSFVADGQDGFTVLRGLPRTSGGMSDIALMELYLRRLPRPVRPPEDSRFIPSR
ncbi:MAG TPA: 5'-nucleotidase C-terminal domain-containing protein [Gemmatimonadales bacterium]|nr:5'-nucleotidase C-terminal domain-containing protein [Gemmatimonadales bacterium]